MHRPQFSQPARIPRHFLIAVVSRSTSKTTMLVMLLTSAVAVDSARAGIVAEGNVVPTPPVNGAALTVGDMGVGYLTVDGSTVLSSTTAIVGDDATGIGFTVITEHRTTWNTVNLTVGLNGIGDLEVSDGAFVNVDYVGGVGDLIVGSGASAIGTIVVDGLGTFLSTGDDTTIGGLSGTGILKIQNDGFVDATNTPTTGSDVFTIGIRGRVEMFNGRLRTGTLNNDGVILGGGWIGSAVDIQNLGRIESGLGDLLIVNSSLDNQGYIEINGAEIEFAGLVINQTAASEITLRDGVARFRPPGVGTGLTISNGVLASLEGANDVFGTLQNQAAGRIVVAGESTAVFHDNVTNSGSLEVAAGSAAIYLGTLTMMGAGATLSVGLGEEDDVLEFGQLDVSGTAELAGALRVSLVDGYLPSAGDAFQIVSASGVTGAITLQAPPPLPGQLSWDLDVSSSGVLLSVAPPALVGDYNGDFKVSAADYTVWRNSLNDVGSGLPADGNANGRVDLGDYAVWKSQYGESIPPPPGSGHAGLPAVPEPETMATCLMGTLGLICGLRRR
jgi:T5SS/PEP-CTERM-associated repeat protein